MVKNWVLLVGLVLLLALVGCNRNQPPKKSTDDTGGTSAWSDTIDFDVSEEAEGEKDE
ncbi:MAG: hypothetical protein FWE37_03325 [Spirochaetaceae bacterium]|nr:hypothetical protein [Spirochaetaceae bacterium]